MHCMQLFIFFVKLSPIIFINNAVGYAYNSVKVDGIGCEKKTQVHVLTSWGDTGMANWGTSLVSISYIILLTIEKCFLL